MVSPNTTNHYYTFGWSGLLSHQPDIMIQFNCFQALTKELQEKYWQHGIYPKYVLLAIAMAVMWVSHIAAARQNTIHNPHYQ